MGDLAALFTTTTDNRLYPFTRYSSGHQMDFVLRPGEKLVRFFKPEEPGLFYLPYKFDGSHWTEFPQEIAEYHIRTAAGPRSQKDNRLWATGRIEYNPGSLRQKRVTVIDMPSPYVIIDARFTMNAELPSAQSSLMVETSVDGGRTWTRAGKLTGTHHGAWSTEPEVLVQSEHGRLTAVSGRYSYKVRITKSDATGVRLTSIHLVTRIQLNPRSLPGVQSGANLYAYSSNAPVERIEIPTPLSQEPAHHLKLVSEQGQQFLLPTSGHPGYMLYALDAGGRTLTGFEAGARFLNLSGGLAPDKLTAETRHTSITCANGPASLSWSTSPDGPFHELWNYPAKLEWKDHQPIDRLLLWPEVFRQVHALPSNTKRVYVKLSSAGPAIDSIRLAVYAASSAPSGHLKITQVWREAGVRREHVEQIDAATAHRRYSFNAGAKVSNESVALSNE